MPYADPAHQMLPFASGCDTSRAGSEAAKKHAQTQREVLAAVYRQNAWVGVTDAEMADYTGLPVSTICARRNELGCIVAGRRMGPHNVTVKAWKLPEVVR